MRALKRLFQAAPAAIIGLAAISPPASAAEALACSTDHTGAICGKAVLVGDSALPCVTRDGKAYCPIVTTFHPRQQA